MICLICILCKEANYHYGKSCFSSFFLLKNILSQLFWCPHSCMVKFKTMAIVGRFLACSASTSLLDVHRRKGVITSPGSSVFPVSPYIQSEQLPPTWDGRWWVKRFGPGDPPSPAASLSALQVSLLAPSFQTSYYFWPTRWYYRWLSRLF